MLSPMGSKRWQHWVPWLCGLVAFGLAAKNLIGAYADFGIYLDVARELRLGELDIYRSREPVGSWVYPHVAALPFAALQLFLSEAAIRWLWCGLLGLAVALLLRATARAMVPLGGLAWWQWIVFGVLFQRCIAQNLTHGQLSLWVGACVASGIVQLQRRNDFAAGAWLGVAAALKLTPLLLLPALPLMRRTRAAAAMLTVFATAVLILPWPFCGTDQHLRHLGGFWRRATEQLAATDQAEMLQLRAGPSVSGTFDYLLQDRPFDRDGHTVAVIDLSPSQLAAVKALWSTLLGALLTVLFWRARRHPDGARLALQAAAVLLATVFFAPLVRVYHLAATLLPFALFCRGPRAARDVLWWSTAIAILFAMTLRQKKLLGETLWRNLDASGLLHFALVAMLCWLVRESRRAPAESR